jgi:hypothetical protein
MAEIITHDPVHEGECPRCKARVRYHRSEVSLVSNAHRKAVLAIVCPQCSGTIRLTAARADMLTRPIEPALARGEAYADGAAARR